MIPYSFVYELMRAYPNSHLLVNKRVIGGKVKNFLNIPNSYKQVIIKNGQVERFQYFEFSAPFWLKFFPISVWLIKTSWRERFLINFLKKIEKEIFNNNLLPLSDKEIENLNTHWKKEVYRLRHEVDDYPFDPNHTYALVQKPNGEIFFVSTEPKGKLLPDVYEVLLKPLPYF